MIKLPWLRDSLDWLWPRDCEGCGVRLVEPARGLICPDCAHKITTDPWPTCQRCASTVGPHVDTSQGCTHCERERYAFDAACRLGPYQDLLREMILKCKTRHGELLAFELGRLAGETLQARLTSFGDVLVPIPLHWRRRIFRGHNQALAIAQGLASVIQKPLQSGWLVRPKFTPIQASVSATQRRENLKMAFRVRKSAAVQSVRIMLIDDVLTTGSTAHWAARVLKDQGAAQVNVFVLAHR